MRRKEKQVLEQSAIDSIIAKAEICHLAMSNNDHPYVVPMSFGYKDNALYFHSAHEGKKLEMIAANPRVSFEMCINDKIIKAEKACNWGMNYKSVIGFGKASFIEDPTEKIRALDIIMSQYANQTWEYQPKMLEKTVVVKIDIQEITGKQSLD